ncbi:MAG: MATE family efflux transporter [Myxococcales bacterium]|nr:MATE family efflux transporter [Myxococcales bacterium]MCB9646264.1 MATE family efflux transporter [Deltaproteobacteria bacterium]
MDTPSRPGLLHEAGRLVRLAAPMMVAQGGLMTMGVVDTFVIGRVSALEMGAVSLGNTLASVILVLGLGLVMGLEPLVSQAHGAGEGEAARGWFASGIWLALMVSLPLAALLWISTRVLGPAGVSPAIVEVTTLYVYARLPGVPFNVLYGACRSFLTSVERVRPVLVAVLLANAVNVVADVVLVFGLDMGAVGVGLATSASWAIMFGVAAMAGRAAAGQASLRLPRPDPAALWRVAQLGWPIGLQLSVEVGIFALVGVLVARFGAEALSGHHIALTLASLTFMCAVGLAVATTTRVGVHIGRGDPRAARRSGFLGVVMGAAFMGLGGVAFLVMPETLASWFAPGAPGVIRVGAELLRIAAVFSVADGVQVVAAGALRGAGDTRWPFYANTAAHWLLGFPLALYLGFEAGLGVAGFWWALALGLVGVAVTLTLRFAWLSGRGLARVR